MAGSNISKVVIDRFSDILIVVFLAAQVVSASSMQTTANRRVSGVILDQKGQVLNGVTVIARGITERRAITNEAGQFALEVPDESFSLAVQGQYIKPYQRDFPVASSTEDLEIEIEYLIPPIHQSIVIVASALQPNVETINSELYRKTLFARDDQLLDTLAAGIGLFPQLSYISRV